MHPRNPYQTPPDFKELALKPANYVTVFNFSYLQKLSGKIEIDFKDPAAVRALTTVLLKKDFNLDVELPSDRLIPTLPLRLNYLLWIEDLLSVPGLEPREVHGIDIGTGACCIYPILAARKNKWKFTATESDETNYESSVRTVECNHLGEFVTVKKVTSDSMLHGNISFDVEYNFTMCNPPFFDSSNLGPKSRSAKRPEPVCLKSGGSNSVQEIAVEGGEVLFVQKLVKESQDLKSSVKIFTTMVGHKSSIGPIKAMLKEAGALSWTDTEFCQGRTMRWALAWTFCPDISLSSPLASRQAKQSNKKLPPPLQYVIARDRWNDDKGEYSLAGVMAKIVEQLTQLKMEIRKGDENKTRRAVEFIARENTWSHQRRKRREEKRHSLSDEPSEPKKPKIEEEQPESTAETSKQEFFLKGLLSLEETKPNTISILMQWVEGGSGRESVNQILQFLKNHLFDK
nr:EOG090X04JL [Ilyocryptus agilis]